MKIAISSPPYRHNSAGVRVLHYFAYLCRCLGHQTYLSTKQLNPEWGSYSDPFDLDVEKYLFVVPEISPETQNRENIGVVRWVLYHPGELGGPKRYPSHEYVATYHEDYRKNAEEACQKSVDLFYLPHWDLPGIEKAVTRDNTACWYQGKGKRHRPPVLGSIEITRDWPKERAEVIQLLKSSHLFFTSDEHTTLLEEAYLCGCLCFFYFGGTWVQWKPAFDIKIPSHQDDLEKVESFLSRCLNRFSWLK